MVGCLRSRVSTSRFLFERSGVRGDRGRTAWEGFSGGDFSNESSFV